MKAKTKFKVLFGMFIIITFFIIFIYAFDKIVMPTVLVVADSEMKAKATEIINSSIIQEYSKDFNYDEVVKVHKDNDGNIVMMKADTLKMNKIACSVALDSQRKLKDLGYVGIKIPVGYISKNNIISYFGPSITVKMQPIGHIETKYLSKFESAGINQTSHKIYVQVKTKVRVIIPLKSSEIEVKHEVPIAETIIVGKVPGTAIQMDLGDAGFKMEN
ncbi:sporulation protein YunB [Haloimpatiens massiliensis]|uniref:sporulation protein YunB n=1 Tax=Haloimpatiens massiliensis TaxID=1658110 RepID=UPI000C84F65B|nr:sporulation protein YunB [Haloimpatiens massiliensis]